MHNGYQRYYECTHNTAYKHSQFEDLFHSTLKGFPSEEQFMYVDLNSGPGVYKRKSESLVCSAFIALDRILEKGQRADCFFIDFDNTVVRDLRNNFTRRYFGIFESERCLSEDPRKRTTFRKSKDGSVNVYFARNNNIIFSEWLADRIPDDGIYGLVFGDPIGSAQGVSRCFDIFSKFRNLDFLLHFSDIPCLRAHASSGHLHPDAIVDRCNRENKFITGPISSHRNGYKMFYATNK